MSPTDRPTDNKATEIECRRSTKGCVQGHCASNHQSPIAIENCSVTVQAGNRLFFPSCAWSRPPLPHGHTTATHMFLFGPGHIYKGSLGPDQTTSLCSQTVHSLLRRRFFIFLLLSSSFPPLPVASFSPSPSSPRSISSPLSTPHPQDSLASSFLLPPPPPPPPPPSPSTVQDSPLTFQLY